MREVPGLTQLPEDYTKLDETRAVRALTQHLDVIHGRVFGTGDSKEDMDYQIPREKHAYSVPMVNAFTWISAAKTYADLSAVIVQFNLMAKNLPSPRIGDRVTPLNDANRAIFCEVLTLLTAFLEEREDRARFIPPALVAINESLGYFRDEDIGQPHSPEQEALRTRQGLQKLEAGLYVIATSAHLRN